MQEEIENRTVNFAISTTKLTTQTVISAGRFLLEKYKQRRMERDGPIAGKQTIKELIGQNQGVTNIDIAKTDLRGFEKYARKYGVDYAVTKDKSVQPEKFLIFFKARDADAMTACFNAYSAEVLRRNKKPSILKELQKMVEKIKATPTKIKGKDTERMQVR